MTEQAWRARAARIVRITGLDIETAERYAAFIGDTPEIEAGEVIVREDFETHTLELARLPESVLREDSPA